MLLLSHRSEIVDFKTVEIGVLKRVERFRFHGHFGAGLPCANFALQVRRIQLWKQMSSLAGGARVLRRGYVEKSGAAAWNHMGRPTEGQLVGDDRVDLRARLIHS